MLGLSFVCSYCVDFENVNFSFFFFRRSFIVRFMRIHVRWVFGFSATRRLVLVEISISLDKSKQRVNIGKSRNRTQNEESWILERTSDRRIVRVWAVQTVGKNQKKHPILFATIFMLCYIIDFVDICGREKNRKFTYFFFFCWYFSHICFVFSSKHFYCKCILGILFFFFVHIGLVYLSSFLPLFIHTNVYCASSIVVRDWICWFSDRTI